MNEIPQALELVFNILTKECNVFIDYFDYKTTIIQFAGCPIGIGLNRERAILKIFAVQRGADIVNIKTLHQTFRIRRGGEKGCKYLNISMSETTLTLGKGTSFLEQFSMIEEIVKMIEAAMNE